MSFTYVVGTAVGDVRLNISDTDVNNQIFTDEEINRILTLSESDTDQATGRALLIIANDKARLATKKKAGNYSEDLTAIARSLREQAKEWFDRAQAPYDDVAEQTFTPRGEKEFINRESQRNNI